MKRKILFVATVASHINAFHIPDMEFFKKNGWEVHVAVGTDPEIRGEKEVPCSDQFHILPLTRSPFKIANISAIKELKKLIYAEKYDMIHCHNPMGGFVARAAARKSREDHDTKVIYTCHGAHFYKGAPLWNWLIYYPVEKILSRYTDVLITINQEDYNLISRKFKKCRVEYVPGVGFGMQFEPVQMEERNELRRQYGYKENDFILMFVGELTKGKNQEFLIEVVHLLKDKIPELKLILIGIGANENRYKEKVRALDLGDKVDFLGYRTDVPRLLNIASVYTAASVREGLAVNVLEALGSGLPVIVTEARGQSDVIENGVNGFIVNQSDYNSFSEKILFLYRSPEMINAFSEAAYRSAEDYRRNSVALKIEEIYRRYMK